MRGSKLGVTAHARMPVMLSPEIKKEIHEATQHMKARSTFWLDIPDHWDAEALEHLWKILNRYPIRYSRGGGSGKEGYSSFIDIRWQ